MFVNSIIIIASLAIVEPAKILIVVPTPSISHQVVFHPLIQELVNRGHEVTSVTTDPIFPKGKSPSNLKEIDLHDLSYKLWIKLFDELEKNDSKSFLFKLATAYRVFSEILEEQLKDNLIQELIRDKSVKYDLMILESCANPILIYSHIFKAPVISMSSFGAIPGNMEMIGAVIHPLLYPTQYHQRIYNLTVWEKLREFYNDVLLNRILKEQDLKDDKMLQNIFGNNIPPLNELKKNVDMLFLNVNPIWLHNQPVPPGVVYTWGIHHASEKLLPKDLQEYLDSSKNGAIYISFGTNIRTSAIPADKLKILIEVFSRLPYNILWKWDSEELPGKSENIKISKWFPQADILRHPNLKLFITQGGLQSTDEAIYAGVPVIGIPMFSDQVYNTEKYVHFKIGLTLDFKSLTVESFENAIKDILENHASYKKNINQLRTQVMDQPQTALERAVWWVEYVLRHGGARHLRAPAANMSWAEYYELELVFIVLSGFVVIISLLSLLLYSFFKCLSGIVNLKKNKTKLS